jgi:hypothetical protein
VSITSSSLTDATTVASVSPSPTSTDDVYPPMPSPSTLTADTTISDASSSSPVSSESALSSFVPTTLQTLSSSSSSGYAAAPSLKGESHMMADGGDNAVMAKRKMVSNFFLPFE